MLLMLTMSTVAKALAEVQYEGSHDTFFLLCRKLMRALLSKCTR